MKYRVILQLLALIAIPTRLAAQSEAALKRFFEGKRVVVKIEMPATKYGIDIQPGQASPIDFRAYSARIKEHGVALRPGESALVTGIRVKEKLVEFQLAGGGYGTFWDDTDTNVYVPSSPKSRREKDLEKSLQDESDPRAKKRMKEELSDLRSDRQRDDRLAQAVAAQASETKKQAIRERALDGGSRFNLRFEKGYLAENPPTPEMIMQALAEYVDFSGLPSLSSAVPK